MRATLFTYEHIQTWLTLLVWIFRWVAVPAKAIATTSAQWAGGYRVQVSDSSTGGRRPTAVIAALVAVRLPSHFFTGLPHERFRIRCGP